MDSSLEIQAIQLQLQSTEDMTTGDKSGLTVNTAIDTAIANIVTTAMHAKDQASSDGCGNESGQDSLLNMEEKILQALVNSGNVSEMETLARSLMNESDLGFSDTETQQGPYSEVPVVTTMVSSVVVPVTHLVNSQTVCPIPVTTSSSVENALTPSSGNSPPPMPIETGMVIEVQEGVPPQPVPQSPDFGYKSYAHNFDSDAIPSEKESDTTPNTTSDEQDIENHTMKESPPNYTVHSGYSPRAKETLQKLGQKIGSSLVEISNALTKQGGTSVPTLPADLLNGRSNITELIQETSSDKTVLSQINPPPRKVGRPRKNQVVPVGVVKKKSPGRPRKIVQNSENPLKVPCVSAKEAKGDSDNFQTNIPLERLEATNEMNYSKCSKRKIVSKFRNNSESEYEYSLTGKSTSQKLSKRTYKRKIVAGVRKGVVGRKSKGMGKVGRPRTILSLTGEPGTVSTLASKSGEVKPKKRGRPKKIREEPLPPKRPRGRPRTKSNLTGPASVAKPPPTGQGSLTFSELVPLFFPPTVDNLPNPHNLPPELLRPPQFHRRKKKLSVQKLKAKAKLKAKLKARQLKKVKGLLKKQKKVKKAKLKRNSASPLTLDPANPSLPLSIEIPEDPPFQGSLPSLFKKKKKVSAMLLGTAPVITGPRITIAKPKKKKKPKHNNLNSPGSLSDHMSLSPSEKSTLSNKEQRHVFLEPPKTPHGKTKQHLEQAAVENSDLLKDKNKEQTPSPQSASTCLSEETLLSDSGIGTDNNSNPERNGSDKQGRSSVTSVTESEVSGEVLETHLLATSNHGLYGYGKRDKYRRHMHHHHHHHHYYHYPSYYHRRRKRKARLNRGGRLSPTFLFELDSLILQMRSMRLTQQEESLSILLKSPQKKSPNFLTLIGKENQCYSSYLRPSYLATALRNQEPAYLGSDQSHSLMSPDSQHSQPGIEHSLPSPLSHHQKDAHTTEKANLPSNQTFQNVQQSRINTTEIRMTLNSNTGNSPGGDSNVMVSSFSSIALVSLDTRDGSAENGLSEKLNYRTDARVDDGVVCNQPNSPSSGSRVETVPQVKRPRGRPPGKSKKKRGRKPLPKNLIKNANASINTEQREGTAPIPTECTSSISQENAIQLSESTSPEQLPVHPVPIHRKRGRPPKPKGTKGKKFALKVMRVTKKKMKTGKKKIMSITQQCSLIVETDVECIQTTHDKPGSAQDGSPEGSTTFETNIIRTPPLVKKKKVIRKPKNKTVTSEILPNIPKGDASKPASSAAGHVMQSPQEINSTIQTKNKRGRKRKHPLPHSLSNSSQNDLLSKETVRSTPEVEIGSNVHPEQLPSPLDLDSPTATRKESSGEESETLSDETPLANLIPKPKINPQVRSNENDKQRTDSSPSENVLVGSNKDVDAGQKEAPSEVQMEPFSPLPSEVSVKVVYGQGKPAAASMRTVLAGVRGRKFQIPRPPKKKVDGAVPVLDESSIPLKKRKLMKEPPPEVTTEDSCDKPTESTVSVDPTSESILPVATTTKKPLLKTRKRGRPLLGLAKAKKIPKAKVQSAEEVKKGGKNPVERLLQRKRFWKAGIYSDTCKEDPSKKSSTNKIDEEEPDLESIYGPVGGLLPIPWHAGTNLLDEYFDYELPYDIWLQHDQKKLVRKVELPKFKKIRQNLYFDVKPNPQDDTCRCSCQQPADSQAQGCLDDCLNRVLQHECDPNTCPCKEQCANQRMQRRQWCPGLQRFKTDNCGWGIRSSVPIKEGDFITEYLGEVISVNEFWRRALADYQYQKHHYCLNLDGGMVIDGYSYGNDARFVNHSCEPNCMMEKWYVNGTYRVGMFALRDIQPGEELSYDYNFHSFNTETQQECRCGSANCRGLIGGRGRSKSSSTSRERSQGKKTEESSENDKKRPKENSKKMEENRKKMVGRKSCKKRIPKPMSIRELNTVADRQVFLLRNLERIKKIRLKQNKGEESITNTKDNALDASKQKDKDVFLAQFTALKSPRSVKTRRLAEAEENSEVTKMARLAQVFKDIYTEVCTYQDVSGQNLAIPFMNLPTRKSNPDYYQRVPEPVDLSKIERHINEGHYKSTEAFDEEFQKVFRNAEKYHGKKSELGRDALSLRKALQDAMDDAQKHFDDILGANRKQIPKDRQIENAELRGCPSKDEEEEEVIRCLCGLYVDEGLMIQCEKCLVWQHCDCLGMKEPVDLYLCELCEPRPVPKEIVMNPQPKFAQAGHTYHLCLMKDDTLKIKQGDSVYLAHENNKHSPVSPIRSSKRVQSTSPCDDLNVFRIEKLWKDDSGERFAFGHHFLRPHETHHTPSRKFFQNEIFRVPLYEIIKLDAIVGVACVMDFYSFCKGRPKGVKEEDVYICEYRLDKTAHLFHPIGKSRLAICTKSYAFDKFEQKIVPKRDYTPHVVPEHFKRGSGGRPSWKCNKDKQDGGTDEGAVDKDGRKGSRKKPEKLDPIAERKRLEQLRQSKRENLNTLMQELLDKIPKKTSPVDLSYLLEDRKRRGKRPPTALEGFF